MLPSILRGKLIVWVLFQIIKPKSSKLVLPRGDIDNYIKLLFDCLNKRLWEDDAQVEVVSARKQWATTEWGFFDIWIKEQDNG